MRDYQYPDPGDRITATMIDAISTSDSWSAEEEAVLVKLGAYISALEPPRYLLDIGAGEGRLTLRFREFLQHATLVEPDIDRAASAASEVGGRAATLSARVLPALADASAGAPYDIVFLSHVLQHVRQQTAKDLILKASELCRRGGLVYIATNLASSGTEEYRLAKTTSAGTWDEHQVTSAEFERCVDADEPGVLPIHCFPQETLVELIGSAHADPIVLEPFHCSRGSTDEGRDIAIVARRR